MLWLLMIGISSEVPLADVDQKAMEEGADQGDSIVQENYDDVEPPSRLSTVSTEPSVDEVLKQTFMERVNASLEDLSIFSVFAENVPERGQVAAQWEHRGLPLAILGAMTFLVFFLMVPLPLLVFGSDLRKIDMCRNTAKFRNRIAAFALLIYLQFTLFSTLVEARVLLTFSEVSRGRRSSTWYAIGAVCKIMSGASILMATCVVFLNNPSLSDLLLNSIALNYLLEVDQTTMRVFRTSYFIVTLYNSARRRLKARCDRTIRENDPLYYDLLHEHAFLHNAAFSQIFRASVQKAKSYISSAEYARFLFFVSLFVLVVCGTMGPFVVISCLPQPNHVDR